MPIYLDIEVLQQDPYPWMVRPQEIEAPSNYKDPEKIAAFIEKAVREYHADLRARTSLEPLLGGVVVAIGVAVDDADPVVLGNPTGDESGERELLAKVERAMCRTDRLTVPIVSWSGAYDWGYLAKRALRHGLYPLARRMIANKPWGDRLHIDAREPWTRLDSRSLSRLQDVARYLGLEVADTTTGAEVTALWRAGDWVAVIEHCRSDVRLLRDVTRIEVAAGWLDVGGEVPEPGPVPPPRGSALDLASRIDRLQQGRPHEDLAAALAAGQIRAPSGGMRAVLDALPTTPTEQLRAILVALGGQP